MSENISSGASNESSHVVGESKVPGIRELLEACGGEIVLANGDWIVNNEEYGLSVWRSYERMHGGSESLVVHVFGSMETKIAAILAAYHAQYVTPLEGERDRLRAALERIAAYPGDHEAAEFISAQSDARSALTEGEAVS